MPAKKSVKAPDLSTEEKIKEAARNVFTRKGYAATRTRDIAEEAGINLALLNYYFRSKEKLFEQVMLEKMQTFFGTLAPILNDKSTSLETKTERLVEQYIDMLILDPNMPLFVLSEVQKNLMHIKEKTNIRSFLMQSSFIRQLKEKRSDLDPFHFVFSIMGMTVIPFILRPGFVALNMMKETEFTRMMTERKKLIPLWIKTIINTR